MTLIIVDDGTLDTVVKCTVCNERMRYNPEPIVMDDGGPPPMGRLNQRRRMMALEMANEDHRCD